MLCIIAVSLPWTVSWVPFLYKTGTYGLSGPWCWIGSINRATCQDIEHGLLEQILLWYAPFGIVAIIALLCIICELVFLGYLRSYHNFLEKQTKAMIKEMLLLLAFLVVFCIVWVSESTIRGIEELPDVDMYVLWTVYAITTPIAGIIVPFGFFSYLLFSKFSRKDSHTTRRHHYAEVNTYSNLQTGKEADRLIHNPSRVSLPSHTSDCDFNRFLTNSDNESEPLLSASHHNCSTVETT